MAVDIVAVIASQRLSSISRSVAGSENHEKRVANLAVRTQAMLTGAVVGGHKDNLEEYMLRDTYMKILEEYNRAPNYAYHGQEFNARGLALWRRAVKALKASGTDRETYVRAQFTWFHDKFRKAPEPLQLTTDEAVIRAATVAPVSTVRNGNIDANIPIGDLFRRCEKQMSDLQRAQKLTREEVYRNLVLTKMVLFPESFLKADPTWAKVKNG